MSLSCCFEQAGETGVVSFSGSLTDRNVNDLNAALFHSLNNAHWIVINLDQVTDADETGLHSLCRVVGSSTRDKKILLLTGRYLTTLQRRIAAGDLACTGECRLDRRDCVFVMTDPHPGHLPGRAREITTTADLPHRNVIPGLTRNPEDCEMPWIPDKDFGNDGTARCPPLSRSLAQRLIEVQEAERLHLARERHDEIGQAMTSIKLNLQAMQRTGAPAHLADPIAESIDIVDQTIRQVRSLSLDLRPSLLDDFGLVPTLRWHL